VASVPPPALSESLGVNSCFIGVRESTLLPSQLVWFAYVLDLVMHGDLNLKNNRFHKELARYEEYIMSNQEYIKKIELVSTNDFQGRYNEVLEDEEEEEAYL